MRRARQALIGLVVLALGIQLVPYGRSHTNPPVLAEPTWDSPRTRELAARACFDCHSNETVWPWYSNVAPVSWLVQRDTDEGRGELNFSEWTNPKPRRAGQAAEAIREGGMPPALYLPTHPEARLSAAEKDELLKGVIATMGDEPRRRPGG
ncbi:MAG: heme-binding domain-containing protein [Dehalococcoidia bacterium]